MDTYPERIREIRLSKGLSLARAAASIGVSLSHLWRIESGRRAPGATTVVRLAQLYGQDPVDALQSAGAFRRKKRYGQHAPGDLSAYPDADVDADADMDLDADVDADTARQVASRGTADPAPTQGGG
jgi:transcriptional regulator with XRE-family HTH domain